ncbi:hypothetical protein [Bradyrhizobium sp.]|uniref:hypothetical protein n=1 Tax=Bradyrhizobium sp. TaxID=376 RepID=UPI0026115D3D|nr:hypothetical protein [Bradyrhizobium sp.]
MSDVADQVKRFLDQCTVKDPKARLRVLDLYSAYVSWSASSLEPRATNILFSRCVRMEIGLKRFKSDVSWWIGIKLAKPAKAVSNGGGLEALEAAWQAASPTAALTFLLSKISAIGAKQ